MVKWSSLTRCTLMLVNLEHGSAAIVGEQTQSVENLEADDPKFTENQRSLVSEARILPHSGY